ncbi:MAG TPA: S8 family serine peptidase [Halococcus sp.]|nr:S8 family serine peptidase [Halococcus sp.]
MNDGDIINRRTFLEAAGAFSLLSATAGSAAADRTERRNELLVGVAPSASSVRRTAERALPAEARIVHENARLGYVMVELPARASATAKAAVTKAIENRRGIEYVEPNAIHEALSIPDDPRFDEQYAPQMVNAPAAWEHTLGDRDVTVAIVDTGIEYDHPDLDGNVGSDVGYDFVDGDDDPSPGAREEHHGTHVAGIAAAEIDNGTGISGLANATLLGVRALNENGWGYTSNIADGIQWATDHGVDIINLSLGGGGYTETMQKAVSYANGKDVVIVAAAGNDYGGPVLYPAAYEECIAVSALDADGTLAAYSNMGPEVELCAPGTSVLSTWPDGGYERLSGTSMATPVVSGVAALVRSQESLSDEEVRARLKDTAVDVGLSTEEQGSGRVDAAGAVGTQLSRTLAVAGDGSRTDYAFTISGDLTGQSLTQEDSITGSTATGAVGPGRDSYSFSGEIIDYEQDGDATVYLDGEEIDPAQLPLHSLVIDGDGSRTDYTLTVSGDLIGESLTHEDSISGSTATGAVGPGRDSYRFSGEITDYEQNGDATVFLDGERVDPEQLRSRTLAIDGDGSRTDYTFTVSGDLTGESLTREDSISGSTATGAVGPGRDSYRFSGDILDFSMTGDATVYLDGEQADPATLLPHTLAIDGDGSRTDYSFSVSGTLEGESLTHEDSISGSTATGAVGPGRDSYFFSGEVIDFEMDGDATVYLDGEVATGAPFLTNTLVIDGDGSRTDYRFSVSGDLKGESLTQEDSITGSTATGAVGPGRDSYSFSGELIELDVDGDATMFLNGERVDTETPPALGVYSGLSDADFETIDRMEEWQGAPYAVQNLFVPWNPDEGHLNWLFGHILPKIWTSGRVPLITWEPFTPGAQAAAVNTAALVESGEYEAYLHGLADTTPNDIEVRIGNGEYDRYIDSWASRLKEWLAGPDGRLGTADDRQAYIRLAHEMNGDWYPWSPTVGNSSPGSYVRMWRRVHRRFERMGVGAAQWMWCVNADDVGPYSAEQLYPGDAYVDWLAVDGYQWGESMNWSHWESPESIFSNMLSRVRNIADKPVCIAETASTSETRWGYDPERKDEWILDAFEYFANEVDMWCWFNEDKETDWAMFDGVRGTERVAYDGELVNAYAAYRKAVDSSSVSANAAESAPIRQERQRAFLGRGS